MAQEFASQARCTECDEDEDNYTVEGKDINTDEPEDDDRILYLLRCECGEKAAVALTEDGMQSEGPISHENASWNEEDDDDAND